MSPCQNRENPDGEKQRDSIGPIAFSRCPARRRFVTLAPFGFESLRHHHHCLGLPRPDGLSPRAHKLSRARSGALSWPVDSSSCSPSPRCVTPPRSQGPRLSSLPTSLTTPLSPVLTSRMRWPSCPMAVC